MLQIKQMKEPMSYAVFSSFAEKTEFTTWLDAQGWSVADVNRDGMPLDVEADVYLLATYIRGEFICTIPDDNKRMIFKLRWG
jgi:hypothetical protein